MNLFLVRYPDKTATEVFDGYEITPPQIGGKFDRQKFSLVREEILKNDVILFYKSFRLQNGTLQDMIFGYFEVGGVFEKELTASKYLSFDKTRAGFGTLSYSKKRVLTRYSSPENFWSLPEFFRGLNIACRGKSLNSKFRDFCQVRYFENTTPTLCISPVPSRESLVYYDNALLEFVSSVCEDIRGEATRNFSNLKKGQTGAGKTGFVKYSYRPDRRSRIYCRVSHTLGRKQLRECRACSLYKKGACEWSLPVYNANPYVPSGERDAFAYFDVLLEKGLVMDYRDE